MVKSKKAQLIFRIIYVLIGIVGIIGSFGTFRGNYNPNWYLMFTNISNYICFFVMLSLLCYTARDMRKGITHGETSQAPLFRFCTCIMILITFLVFNTLLGNPFTSAYWTDIQSLIMHLILPVMFIVDYMLFSKKRSVNVFAPLYACIMPLIYVLFILIRAEALLGTGAFVFPYYFLDFQSIGWGAVVLFLFILMLVFVGFGYLLWAYDKLVRKDNGKLGFDFTRLPKPVEIVEDNQTNDCLMNENKEELVENKEDTIQE